jgi:uncharacterized Zn finger protein
MKCPKCGELAVEASEGKDGHYEGTYYVDASMEYECMNCGHKWKEERNKK